MQAAAQAKILSSPTLKSSSDDPISGFVRFAYLNTKVTPLNNLHCREAIEYAADKTSAADRVRRPGGRRRRSPAR